MARHLPYNIEAEMAVLGSILMGGGKAARKTKGKLSPEHFYREAHGFIYAAMSALSEKSEPIDIVTLKDELTSQGKLDECGGYIYLMQLNEYTPTAANLDYYARIVNEHYIRRRSIELFSVGAGLAYAEDAEPEKLIAYAYEVATKLSSQNDTTDAFTGSQACVQGALDSFMDAGVGIYTGISNLDKLLGGLRDTEMTVVAARPGRGKTAFALQCLILALAQGHEVIFVSAEMPKEQLTRRLILREAQVNWQRVTEREGFEKSELERMRVASLALNKLPFHIIDRKAMREITAQKIAIATESFLLNRKPKKKPLVIVDYIQRLDVERMYKNESRERQVGITSTELSNMAVALGVPVLALAQLKRPAQGVKETRPTMDNLRESGQIEADASNIILLHQVYDPAFECREEAEAKVPENKTKGSVPGNPYANRPEPSEWEKYTGLPSTFEAIVAKQRDGAEGIVQMSFLKSMMKMSAYDKNDGFEDGPF